MSVHFTKKVKLEVNKKIAHLCLMDEDPTAILTPIVDPDIPSHKLVIASTPEHMDFVKNVVSIAELKGYEVEHRLIPDTLDCFELRKVFTDIFSELTTSEYQVWFNASTGQRMQSLLAFDIAKEFNVPTYIINDLKDSLFWVHPKKSNPINIQDKLKIKEYVGLYKSELISRHNQEHIDEARKQLGKKWVSNISIMSKALATLNYLAFTAKGSEYLSASMSSDQIDCSTLKLILNDLSETGLIKIKGSKVAFLCPENKFFCNGGWLEEFVFATVLDLKAELKTIQDQAHSAVLARKFEGKIIKNEIDVLALVNNKLHLLECKTKKMFKGEGANSLYKLDSINKVLAGIRGRAALVSYFALTDSEKLRAHELSIRVFGPEELVNFKHHLKNWLARS